MDDPPPPETDKTIGGGPQTTGGTADPSDYFTADRVKKRIKDRFFRALDYLSIFLFVFIVYLGAVVFDYLLFLILWALLAEEVKQYPIVADILDYARIGLAVVFIAAALSHGVMSAINQFRLDFRLQEEGRLV